MQSRIAYEDVGGYNVGNVAGDEVVIVASSNIQFLLFSINVLVNTPCCGPQAGGVSKAQGVKGVVPV